MYMYAILPVTQMVKINSQVKDFKCSQLNPNIWNVTKKKIIITQLSHMLQDEHDD